MSLDLDLQGPHRRHGEQADHVLLENPTDIVVILDAGGILLGASQPFADAVGIRREEVIGRLVWDLFSPGVTSFRREHFDQVVLTGQAVRMEEVRTGRWYDTWAYPIFTNEGRVVRVAVVARDITVQKHLEQALREREGRFRTFFHDSPVPLWDEDLSEVKGELDRLRAAGVSDFHAYFEAHADAAADLRRRIRRIDMNRAALALYKLGSKEEALSLVDRPMDPLHLDGWRKELVAIAGGATLFELDTIRRTSEGVPLNIRLKWTAAPGCEDTLSRILVSVADITERVRMEEELRRSWQRAARGRQLLLALSHTALEAQCAHSVVGTYRALGRQMTDLGLNAVVLGVTDDGEHLVIRYSNHELAVLQAADAILGAPVLQYHFTLKPGGVIDRLLHQGGAELLTEPVRAVAEMLPEALRPRAAQLAALVGADHALCAPLGSSEGAQGLLAIIGSELTEADSQTVSAFANQTAISLSNARLFQEARNWAVELEQRVEERSAQVTASEARYRAVFESSSDALLVLDRQGRYIDANPAASRLLGFGHEELLSRNVMQVAAWAEGVSPDNKEKMMRERWALWCRDASLRPGEWLTKSGERVSVQVRASPLIYDGQEAMLATARDMTEVVRAQAALQAAQEETLRSQRLLLALSQAGQAVQRARTEQEVLGTIGDEIEKLGYHALVMSPSEDESHLVVGNVTWKPSVMNLVERLLGRSPLGVRIPLAADGLLTRVLQSGESAFCESSLDLSMRGFPALGRAQLERAIAVVGAERSIFARMAAGGRTTGMLGIFGTDLTQADISAVTAFANQTAVALENAHLVEKLTTGREQMQTLAGQVVSAQEDERRRLSRALHDEAGQSLTALTISLELIGRDLPAEQAALHTRIHDAVVLSRQTLDRIRNLAQDLRPPALDAVGLNYTLQGLCHDFGARTRLAIDYHGHDLPTLPDPVTIALYRFLQESLTNVVRHANAHHVRVDLCHDAETLRLMILDDGRGFDPKAGLKPEGRPRGLGLVGMQERLHLLGGWLEIESQPGKGTSLVAHIPIMEGWDEDDARDSSDSGG